jgi:3-deoxy-D-manno-octulosonic-acid transferase
VTDAARLTLRIGAWIKDGAERERIAAAAGRAVERFGGALDRTVAALEPYFMQLRIQNRSIHA